MCTVKYSHKWLYRAVPYSHCTVCTVYKGCKVKIFSAGSHPFSYNHVNSERAVKSLYHRKSPAASTQWLSVTNCNLSSDLSSDIK